MPRARVCPTYLIHPLAARESMVAAMTVWRVPTPKDMLVALGCLLLSVPFGIMLTTLFIIASIAYLFADLTRLKEDTK